jgi:hypothetical protein
MKFEEKIKKFMYGRYGPDELYSFLFTVYIILLIINIFAKSFLINIISLIIVIYMFYRFFSKKIYDRSDENQLYLHIKKNICKPFRVIRMNFNDKNHIYKLCYKCGTILKFPIQSKAGYKKATCPRCKKKVKLFTIKKKK